MNRGRAEAAGQGTPDVARLRRRLVTWYRRHRRDLPWRRTRDPYRIWISEIMLQQTRVEAVLPHYERFLARFPDVAALAAAPLDDVLHAWAGLGYYRRARQLHTAARTVLERHAGQLPQTATALRALPGIGAYTAGAVSSIAFDAPEAILDGNVVRVFCRLWGIDADVESAPVRARLWTLAAAWARCRAPGDANQALMELGALVCSRPAPRCGICPLARDCRAHAAGRERDLPRPRRRRPLQRVDLAAAVVRSRGAILFVRRASGTLLEDWWELPTWRDAGDIAAVTLQQRLGVMLRGVRQAATVRHAILQNRIELRVLVAEARRRTLHHTPPARAPKQALANLDLAAIETRWVAPAAAAALPVSTLARKALSAARPRAPRARRSSHRGT